MGCNSMNFSTSASWTIGSPSSKSSETKARGSSSASVSVTRRQLRLPLACASANAFPLRFFRDDSSPSSRSHSNSHSRSHSLIVKAEALTEPLRVMISGAPASGKGTQCQLITCKFGLVHVSAGDLLRAEIATGSENGKRAKEYMEKGQLVPDEIVVMMVKERLLKQDSVENGWLLDGYPRSLSQATALKEFGIEPDIFILLEVSEDSLVERVVGRRLDPVTGRIYHLKYSTPETKEIADRLTQRFDDTEEKVKLRLNTHHQNVEAVLSMYNDITVKIDGNVSKEEVFAQIDGALSTLLEQKKAASGSVVA